MKPRAPATRPGAGVSLPAVFRVGEHALSIVYVADGRWTVSVDGGPASSTFMTQVEAWEAGVHEADDQDRLRRP
jgi:hypothetical protein